MTDYTYEIKTVNLKEQADKELTAARENGIHPDELINSHLAIAAYISREAQ